MAALTLSLEEGGISKTFHSILAYATTKQIFSRSLQTPFPEGKKPHQNPVRDHQLRQVIFLLAKRTQMVKWMSVFESFFDNSNKHE